MGSVKHTMVAHTPFAMRRVFKELGQIADDALPQDFALVVTVEVDNGPTAKMRGKFHAMCGDVAKALPEWKGVRMTAAHWKAAFIAAAIEQEWLPGIDGKPVPYRPSSENFSRKKYGDLITVAQAFGDEHQVEWSEKAAIAA